MFLCLRQPAVGMISKVRHKQTGVEYALKTIQLDKISSGMAEEMRNEIEILKRLDHPNIIREYCMYLLYAGLVCFFPLKFERFFQGYKVLRADESPR